MIEKTAIFSPCKNYRYTLSRQWKKDRPTVLFVMLNPSTADANIDDPTIRRCIRYADAWGFGSLMVGNLFAYRATDPKVMKAQVDPVGPRNDDYLLEMTLMAGMTVCAWGVDGVYRNRGDEVYRLLHNPHYLAITKGGLPKHPLYLKKDLKPKPYNR